MEFLFNLFITAVAYLIVPVIFSVIGRKSYRQYSHKTIWKVVIINGACVWLIFQIIRINAGETGTSAAVFLWSAVAYWIMKKILLVENHYKTTVNPFKSIDKEKRYKVAIVVVSLLLTLSFVWNIYQVSVQSKLQDELEHQVSAQSELQDKLEKSQEKLGLFDEYVALIGELEDELEKSQDKIEFFDEYIVMVEDDGTEMYHKYECYRFKGNYFWAYNIEQAIDRGYKPCPICFGK